MEINKLLEKYGNGNILDEKDVSDFKKDFINLYQQYGTFVVGRSHGSLQDGKEALTTAVEQILNECNTNLKPKVQEVYDIFTIYQHIGDPLFVRTVDEKDSNYDKNTNIQKYFNNKNQMPEIIGMKEIIKKFWEKCIFLKEEYLTQLEANSIPITNKKMEEIKANDRIIKLIESEKGEDILKEIFNLTFKKITEHAYVYRVHLDGMRQICEKDHVTINSENDVRNGIDVDRYLNKVGDFHRDLVKNFITKVPEAGNPIAHNFKVTKDIGSPTVIPTDLLNEIGKCLSTKDYMNLKLKKIKKSDSDVDKDIENKVSEAGTNETELFKVCAEVIRDNIIRDIFFYSIKNKDAFINHQLNDIAGGWNTIFYQIKAGYGKKYINKLPDKILKDIKVYFKNSEGEKVQILQPFATPIGRSAKVKDKIDIVCTKKWSDDEFSLGSYDFSTKAFSPSETIEEIGLSGDINTVPTAE